MKFTNEKQKLIYKEKLAEQVYLLKYSINPDLEWRPGQYIGVGISGTYRRSYTIFDLKDGILTLIVDTKPGGLASQFFDKVEVGMESLIIGPYGRFGNQLTENNKVYISTGTGIAPFLSMVKESRDKKNKMTFIFGAKTLIDEVSYRFFKEFIDEDFEYIQCITRHLPEHKLEGLDKKAEIYFERITTALPKLKLDFQNSEFYICGSPQMVEDVNSVLSGLGADKIYYEKYSA